MYEIGNDLIPPPFFMHRHDTALGTDAALACLVFLDAVVRYRDLRLVCRCDHIVTGSLVIAEYERIDYGRVTSQNTELRKPAR